VTGVADQEGTRHGGMTTDADRPGEPGEWRELTGHDRHAACLVAARAGDRAALHALVADLTPLVWHVARAQGLDTSRGEDVVQTVWLILLRNLDSLAEPKALARWLITTTRREAIRARGGLDREDPLTDEVAERLPAGDELPEPAVLRTERDQLLWRAYQQLTDRCQELLRLTVLAGRAEYRLVAEALRMPHGSIGPTRSRCLTALRQYFNSEGGSR
jgi:RNA polymerase sigma factor (sigma-70 family)